MKHGAVQLDILVCKTGVFSPISGLRKHADAPLLNYRKLTLKRVSRRFPLFHLLLAEDAAKRCSANYMKIQSERKLYWKLPKMKYLDTRVAFSKEGVEVPYIVKWQ